MGQPASRHRREYRRPELGVVHWGVYVLLMYRVFHSLRERKAPNFETSKSCSLAGASLPSRSLSRLIPWIQSTDAVGCDKPCCSVTFASFPPPIGEIASHGTFFPRCGRGRP